MALLDKISKLCAFIFIQRASKVDILIVDTGGDWGTNGGEYFVNVFLTWFGETTGAGEKLSSAEGGLAVLFSSADFILSIGSEISTGSEGNSSSMASTACDLANMMLCSSSRSLVSGINLSTGVGSSGG